MKSVVDICASKYNFDGEEAYRMICSSEGVEVKSRRIINEKKINKKLKSMFPLPYSGELIGECCMGIRQNSGLYTQCPTIRPEGAAYCVSCNKQAAKNEHGLPDYGNIQNRLSRYNNEEEFVDPSGKKPVAYTRVMKKYKVSKEEVLEEAEKHGLKIDPRHFVEVEKKSGRPAKEPKETKEAKAKGRPKKSKKVLELAGEEEDLFASLVMSANSNSNLKSNKVEVENEVEVEVETIEVDVDDNSSVDNLSVDNSSLGEVDVVVDAKKSKKLKAKEDEKAAKKQAIEDEKAAKKKAIEDEKAAKKQAIEDEKAAKLKEKEDKAALAEQKKKEKEEKAALAEQKKKEKEEKAALAEQKKKEKEAKVALSEEKKVKKTKSDDDDDRPSPAFVDPPADVVKKIEFEGKKYLKSKNTGIIYNMDQDVIGKWNEEKQRIDFTEVDEVSEDEYDEDE